MMTTARVAARNHHLDHHSTRAKKEKKVSSKIVPLAFVAPRGFAASAFAEAETTRESQLRLGAAKYAIGENNTASLTQGRICLHPRTDHDHHHHPRFPRRTRSCCSSFPLSLSGKVSSLEKARAPKCKEIAHVICTKPPLLKKNVGKRSLSSFRKQLKKEKKRKKRKREETKSREKLLKSLFFLFFYSVLCHVWCLSLCLVFRHFVSRILPPFVLVTQKSTFSIKKALSLFLSL